MAKFLPGEEYKERMIERGFEASKRSGYEKKQFSYISTIYHAIIPKEEQRIYLRNNFTKVELSTGKKKFLNINWPYV